MFDYTPADLAAIVPARHKYLVLLTVGFEVEAGDETAARRAVHEEIRRRGSGQMLKDALSSEYMDSQENGEISVHFTPQPLTGGRAELIDLDGDLHTLQEAADLVIDETMSALIHLDKQMLHVAMSHRDDTPGFPYKVMNVGAKRFTLIRRPVLEVLARWGYLDTWTTSVGEITEKQHWRVSDKGKKEYELYYRGVEKHT